MKKRNVLFSAVCFILLLNLSPRVEAQTLPSQPQGYVSDFAGVLTPRDRRDIEQLAASLEKKTSDQMAVVTVKTTAPDTIEGYAVRLFQKWGIGQKGKDNGVLLLVALADRKVRIETGYGIEGIIPDVLADKIIRDMMIPRFKSGQYSAGIKAGAVAVVSLIAKEAGVEITGQEASIYETVHHQPTFLEKVLRFIFMLVFFSFFLSMRMGLLGWFLLGSMGRRRGGYWYGSGMGGYGGGFSGGFGGFGGGLSGGGGASGGW